MGRVNNREDSMTLRLDALRSCSLASLALGAAFLAHSGPALAAQRTFVASTGSDANPCSLVLPCRSFNAAIAQTSSGGEVVILDTAGYGPMTIDKAIKIIGPSGVYGGISVLGAGSGITTGIVINAGVTDVVTLRGLDIAGVPGGAPLPQFGIDVQNAYAVHIEKSSISNFTQDTGACINALTAKAVQIFVDDSFLRECRYGIFVNGTGPDDPSRVSLIVDNTRIVRMLTTGSSNTGIRMIDAVVSTVRNSTIALGVEGIVASNANTAVHARHHVISSVMTRLGTGAISTGGAAGATLNVSVENSVINATNAALLHGHGQANFTSNVIANNNNSFVDCSGGGAILQSLGFGGGNGSNSVYDNLDTVLPPGCTAYITPTQFAGK
jgi:hypothetical protein